MYIFSVCKSFKKYNYNKLYMWFVRRHGDDGLTVMETEAYMCFSVMDYMYFYCNVDGNAARYMVDVWLNG